MLYTIACKCSAINVVNINEKVVDRKKEYQDEIFGHEVLEITEKIIEPKNCWRCGKLLEFPLNIL